MNDELNKEKQKKEEELNEYKNELNEYKNELYRVNNTHPQKMIELSNELEQKIENLEKEKKELEQKIVIVESEKNSINNELRCLINYYIKSKKIEKIV